MTRRVLWNGVDIGGAVSDAETLGGLLALIDERVSAQGHIVTAVRLDGVDEPAFGHQAVLERHLQPSAVVEVETDTPTSLVLRCVDEALDALPSVRAGVLSVGEAFAASNTSDGNRLLAEVAESLGNLIALAATVGAGMGTPLENVSAGSATGAQVVADLHRHVEELTSAQGCGDWRSVSNTLREDVAPLIDACAELLRALRARAVSGVNGEPEERIA